jgi:hypothetical protein
VLRNEKQFLRFGTAPWVKEDAAASGAGSSPAFSSYFLILIGTRKTLLRARTHIYLMCPTWWRKEGRKRKREREISRERERNPLSCCIRTQKCECCSFTAKTSSSSRHLFFLSLFLSAFFFFVLCVSGAAAAVHCRVGFTVLWAQPIARGLYLRIRACLGVRERERERDGIQP